MELQFSNIFCHCVMKTNNKGILDMLINNFKPNKLYLLRKEKEKPENQLEPDINNIQRYDDNKSSTKKNNK